MLESLRVAVAFMRGARGRLLVLGTVSVLSGFAQAMVLVIIVQSSLALSRGEDRMAVTIGPVAVPEQPIALLLGVSGALVVALLATAYATARITAGIASRLLTRQRRELLGAFLQADPHVQVGDGPGAFQEVLSGDTLRATQIALASAGITTAAMNLIVLLCTAIVLDPLAAGAVMSGVAILSFVSQPLARQRRRYGRVQAAAALALARSLNEVYLAAVEIRINRVEKAFLGRLDAEVSAVSRPYRGLQLMTRFAPNAFQYASFGFVIIVMAVLSQADPAALAALAAVLLLLLRCLTFAQNVQVNLHRISEAVPLVDRISTRLETYRTSARTHDGAPLDRFEELRLEDAWFSYDDGRPALQGMDLALRHGEAVGIIGPSGSGKSSLALVLLRLVTLQRGRLLVNGRDASMTSLDSWYQHVALVPQHPVLVAGSIQDNIAFYRDGVSRADVEAAARAAFIHDEIVALPDGYATLLEAGGGGLSGGQRQRIALARAMVGSPQVLVLDEPTSALDPDASAHVLDSLAALKGTVTILMISHQAEAVSFCDRVLAVERGRVRPVSSLPESPDWHPQRGLDRQALHVR